jgi:Mce-associated membrane protein
MGNTGKPPGDTQDGDAVTTEVTSSASEAEPAAETKPDLQAMLAEAEAEAAEAEAAAAAARAKARAMRAEQERESDDDDVEDTKPRLRRAGVPVVAKIVAALVIVASLAGSGWIVWQHHEASVRQQRAEEFVDAARNGVVDMTSFDFHVIKDQLRHVINNSTGVFKDDLVSRSDQIIKITEASKAVAKGTVTAAAVERLNSPDEAVVLVAGTEEVANAAGNKQPRGFRFRITVSKDGDQLKVSKLEMVL